MFEWIADPQAWIALFTLTALEIVLGIDNIIFINSNISDFDKEFVIAHEVGHYELHDDSIRQFSKIEAFKGSREETQANLFATVFLEANYKDCNSDNEIQKIINYIWCNYL